MIRASKIMRLKQVFYALIITELCIFYALISEKMQNYAFLNIKFGDHI